METISRTDPVEQWYPVPKLALLGLQHVLVMYAGAVAVPLIIGSALQLPKDQIALLVSADLFCCGVVTIVQCLGFWKIGIRLPIMMGIAFTAVPSIIATGTDTGPRHAWGHRGGHRLRHLHADLSPRSSVAGCGSSRRS